MCTSAHSGPQACALIITNDTFLQLRPPLPEHQFEQNYCISIQPVFIVWDVVRSPRQVQNATFVHAGHGLIKAVLCISNCAGMCVQANEVLFVDSEHEDEVLTFREVFLGSRALELLLAGFIDEPPASDEEHSLLAALLAASLGGDAELHQVTLSTLLAAESSPQ